MESLFYLIASSLAFVVFAALGHACWLILASVVKSVSSYARKLLGDGPSIPAENPSGRDADRRAALNYVRYLHDAGRLDEQTARSVLGAIQRDRESSGSMPDSRSATATSPATGDPSAIPPIARTTQAAETKQTLASRPQRTLRASFDTPVQRADQPVAAEIVEPLSESAEKHPSQQAKASSPRQASPAASPQAPPSSAARHLQAPRERAKQYAASRQAAATAAEDSAATDANSPARSKRSLAEWLAAFVEEKNIRWGELVGGLLIISCSAALVVTFWSAIAEQMLLKYVVFNAINAFIYLVGLHAARHWKLPTTSTGLLLIACMLTPLNFLALSSFSEDGTAATGWVLAGELFSLVLFGGLTWAAGRQLFSRQAIAFTVAVLVPSGSELLVRRWVDAEATLLPMYGLGFLAGGVLCISNALQLQTTRQRDEWTESDHSRIWQFLGVSFFATALMLGMLLVKTGRIQELLAWLAPLGACAALPPLVAGLETYRRGLKNQQTTWSLTGLSVAFLGGFLLLSALGAAWPIAAIVALIGLLTWLLFTGVAVWLQLPPAHFLGIVGLAPAFLVTGQVLTTEWTWFANSWSQALNTVLTAYSGAWLGALAAAMVGGSGLWQWIGRSADGRAYLQAGGVIATLAYVFLLVFGFGRFGDPQQAIWGLTLFAIAAVACAIRLGDVRVAWVGSVMLLIALVQGLVFRWNDASVWFTSASWALLVFASINAAIACVLDRVSEDGRKLNPPLGYSAVAATILAVSARMFGQLAGGESIAWPLLLIVGLNSFLLAWPTNMRWLINAGQFAWLAALSLAIDAWARDQAWATEAANPSLHPTALQMQLLGWSLFAAVCSVARRGLRVSILEKLPAEPTRFSQRWQRLVSISRWADHAIFLVAVLGALTVCHYGVIPGVAQELSPRGLFAASTDPLLASRGVSPASHFELPGIPHAPALGLASWVALLGIATSLGLRWSEHRADWRFGILSLLLLSAVFLLSGRWEQEVAVASALRWGLAVYLLILSVLSWAADAVARRSSFLRSLLGTPPNPSFRNFLVSVTLTFVPLLAMILFVVLSALQAAPPGDQQARLWLALTLWLALAATLATVCFWMSRRSSPEEFGLLPQGWLPPTGLTLSVLGVLPTVAMTLFVVGQALSQHPIVGPNPDSFFAEIGLAASYAIPLLIVAGVFVGHAIFLQSEPVAISAGLLCNLCGTAGYLLVTRGGSQFSAEQWYRLAQLNSAISASFAAAWIGYVAVKRRELIRLIPAQLSIASSFFVAALALTVVLLGFIPTTAIEVFRLADLPGWGTWLLLTMVTFGWFLWSESQVPRPLLYGSLLTAALLVGFQADRYAGGNDWLAVQVLIVSCVAAAFITLIVDWYLSTPHREYAIRDWVGPGLVREHFQPIQTLSEVSLQVVTTLLTLVVVFGFRCCGAASLAPEWPMGAWGVSGILFALLAFLFGRAWPLWCATLLFNAAALDEWIESPNPWLLDLVYSQLWVACFPAALWVFLERRRYRLLGLRVSRRESVHQWIVPVAVFILILTSVVGFFANYFGSPADSSALHHWLALLACGVACVACLWDSRATWALGCLYLVGLSLVGAAFDWVDLPATTLVYVSTLSLAAYAIMSSYLWSLRQPISQWCSSQGVPLAEAQFSQGWLIVANSVLIGIVTLLGLRSQFTAESFPLRFALGQAVLVQVVSFGLLAVGKRQTSLRYAALLITIPGTLACGWSFLAPSDFSWVHRLSAAAFGWTLLAAILGLGLAKVLNATNPWTQASLRVTPLPIGLVVLGLIGVISIETVQYLAGFEPPGLGSTTLTAITLLCGCGLLLVAAIVPGRDPLGLSEKGRMAYIYGAELLLATVGLHLRVTVPEFFSGLLETYWPLVVMAIAFLGVGLAEWFHRRGTRVLAEPLERTGLLLPLVPAFGFWFAAPDSFSPGVHYSLVMLTIGALYSGMAVLRRSFLFGALATAAANVAFWSLLTLSEELAVWRHPQLWLIPPALCVLAAAYYQRKSLSEQQLAVLRYFASTTIYVSSTADIFLNGVANAPWLPFVLAALSVAGIFAGIMLRIRAFLYLGLSFLSLALFTLIWYAAVDLEQTWLWYVCGIVAGIAIIALFALFEKKKHELAATVEEMKTWRA